MTVMMTFNQLILAAKAGATYVSLFYNRSKEAGENPLQIIRDYVATAKEARAPREADSREHQDPRGRRRGHRGGRPRHDDPLKDSETDALQQAERRDDRRSSTRPGRTSSPLKKQ